MNRISLPVRIFAVAGLMVIFLLALNGNVTNNQPTIKSYRASDTSSVEESSGFEVSYLGYLEEMGVEIPPSLTLTETQKKEMTSFSIWVHEVALAQEVTPFETWVYNIARADAIMTVEEAEAYVAARNQAREVKKPLGKMGKIETAKRLLTQQGVEQYKFIMPSSIGLVSGEFRLIEVLDQGAPNDFLKKGTALCKFISKNHDGAGILLGVTTPVDIAVNGGKKDSWLIVQIPVNGILWGAEFIAFPKSDKDQILDKLPMKVAEAK